jgi:hypothetical protein
MIIQIELTRGANWIPSMAARVFRGQRLECGGTGSREDHHLFAAVRRFIALHGSARFVAIEELAPSLHAKSALPAINLAGWRWQEAAPPARPGAMPVWVHGMIPEVFAEEIAKPLRMELRDALARLGRGGLIRSEPRASASNYTIKRHVPGVGRPWLIVFEA